MSATYRADTMSDDLAPRDPKTPVRRGGSVTSLTSEPMTDQKVGMSSSDKWPTLPSVVTAPLIGGMQTDYEVLCGETCVSAFCMAEGCAVWSRV